jgi:hypothetical protein
MSQALPKPRHQSQLHFNSLQAALDFSRGRKNQHSKAAFTKVRREEVYEQILSLIRERGSLTCKEFCRATGKQMNQVSGRFSELGHKKTIRQTSERREGCGVWRMA